MDACRRPVANLQRRLMVISPLMPAWRAAKALSVLGIGLLVVCEGDGTASGVITKTDIIPRVSHTSNFHQFCSRDIMSPQC